MMDYTELVKALRCKALSKQCDSCKYGYHLCPDSECNDACQVEQVYADAAAAIEELQAQLPKRGEWIRVNKSDESQRMELYIANHQIPDDESEKSRLIKYLFNIYIESERASQLGIFERSEHEVD